MGQDHVVDSTEKQGEEVAIWREGFFRDSAKILGEVLMGPILTGQKICGGSSSRGVSLRSTRWNDPLTRGGLRHRGWGSPLWSASGPTIISFGLNKRVKVERSTIAGVVVLALARLRLVKTWHAGGDVLHGRHVKGHAS
jgi:hypothetical protein